MKKMGRPPEYNQAEVWPVILDNIAAGSSLSRALENQGMPSYVQAWRMIKADARLEEAYQRAVEQRADRLAEEIIELADEPFPGHLNPALAGAWAQQKRLQVDARKWVTSKLKPKTYGDKLDVTVLEKRISVIDALEQAQARVLLDRVDVTDVVAK